ncbi:GH1 family beta-glucosidase [Saccharopolyspora sp. K220]|uniref:GH1 family beta-glucosidase n=1 Tax=Saccharopolyspora soli TaxID=2926618 RepID=UPI001F562BF6|nr:GH1 family beta-glucosidase [Saccharopolyspora soli]MCI2417853.1 GH1 family beta-glucosidase [Saccharopolyspora soli]
MTIGDGAGVLRFPDGFGWGVATASYQIEGGVREGGRGESIWDRFAHTEGKVLGGDTGDVACDHYHRYREDVALMAELGVTHYRFSLAWPRLQPDGSGALDAAGLDFYSRLIDELLAADIVPWVTLYHWDLPQRLEDAGGWPERDTAHRFAEYAARVHEALADRVRHWTTLNEPWCAAFLGYAEGRHAPGRQDHAAAFRAAHHLLLGHGLAVRDMRANQRDSTFGITLNLYPVDPASDTEQDRDVARRIDGLMNRLFLDPLLRGGYPTDVLGDVAPVLDTSHIRADDEQIIGQPLDFLGVNYYTRHVVAAGPQPKVWSPGQPASPWVGSSDMINVKRGLPTTDMGWEVDPAGLHEVLTRLHREYGPIPLHVTENGAAYPDEPDSAGQVRDPDRVRYLEQHFRIAHQAIADGIDLRGYFVWTLLDNFEWAWGYTKRFGLVHVDYPTQRRTPKDSARWFARAARNNGFEVRERNEDH